MKACELVSVKYIAHVCRPARSSHGSTPHSSGEGSPGAADAAEADTPEGSRAGQGVRYERHPVYPALPTSVPLTYTLTMTACLSDRPKDRPSFSHILVILEDLVQEVASGTYINSDGNPQVRVRRALRDFSYSAA